MQKDITVVKKEDVSGQKCLYLSTVHLIYYIIDKHCSTVLQAGLV